MQDWVKSQKTAPNLVEYFVKTVKMSLLICRKRSLAGQQAWQDGNCSRPNGAKPMSLYGYAGSARKYAVRPGRPRGRAGKSDGGVQRGAGGAHCGLAGLLDVPFIQAGQPHGDALAPETHAAFQFDLAAHVESRRPRQAGT